MFHFKVVPENTLLVVDYVLDGKARVEGFNSKMGVLSLPVSVVTNSQSFQRYLKGGLIAKIVDKEPIKEEPIKEEPIKEEVVKEKQVKEEKPKKSSMFSIRSTEEEVTEPSEEAPTKKRGRKKAE